LLHKKVLKYEIKISELLKKFEMLCFYIFTSFLGQAHETGKTLWTAVLFRALRDLGTRRSLTTWGTLAREVSARFSG